MKNLQTVQNKWEKAVESSLCLCVFSIYCRVFRCTGRVRCPVLSHSLPGR